jgi:hypothetical protein
MESNLSPNSVNEPHGQITPFLRVASRAPLRQAAETWIRHGYTVVYEDDHLIELAREDKKPGRMIVSLAAIGGIVAGLSIVGATLIWLRARPWRIVSLATSPERKVVAHAYRSRVAPGAQES